MKVKKTVFERSISTEDSRSTFIACSSVDCVVVKMSKL